MLSNSMAAEEVSDPLFDAGWLLFGDLYFIPSHHLEEGDGALGLVLRRGYLTFDADFNETWFGRMRFEANQSGEFETYEYDVKFKDLYLGWNLGEHQLIAGLSPTLTFDVIEAFWGLRYLMRTPMDLQGEASRDTGLALRGPLNSDGSLSYRVMLADGRDFGAETGDEEKWMLALNWKPSPGWMIDLYADAERPDGPGDVTTYQAFLAHETEGLRWGLQYSNQDRQDADPLELASAFLVKSLDSGANFIGRIDRIIEPSPKGNNIAYLPFDPSAPATMFLAGLEYRLSPHLTFTPNAVVTRYDRNDEGIRPNTDVYLRFTLFVDFE
jgi:hypothetical protein